MIIENSLLAIAILSLPAAESDRRPDALVRARFGEPIGPMDVDLMALGQGGLSEEPMWEDRIPEIRALGPRLIRLFIQEYFDLLPERGRYHFETLDRAADAILRTGAVPLLAICFKPRVLYPEIRQDIVHPNDWEEWDRLIFSLVRHFKDRGARGLWWEVSNEPDIGEDGGCPYLFKPGEYVLYYRRTAAAVLRADPEARIGGPALAGVRSPILPALLEACEKESAPLHFVSWHIYSSDPGAFRRSIEYAKGLLEKHPSLKPETIIDEWNMDLMNPPSDPRFQPCFIPEVLYQMAEAGLDASCYYHIRDWHVSPEKFSRFMSPRGTAFMARWWNRMPQVDGLFDYQNTPRPAYFSYKLLSRLRGERLRLDSTHPAVHGFLARDDRLQMCNLLLWNFSDSPVRAELALEGLPKDMRVREIDLDPLAPGNDENSRLRPRPAVELKAGDRSLPVDLGPRAVKYWSME